MYAENTVLVVGQAKPSREDAIYNLHGEFYISLVVERDTGRILDVDCNTILSVTKNFVASMFVCPDAPSLSKSHESQRDTWVFFYCP